MKVAMYLRVSTTKQEAENQELQLKEYCKKSGWEVYKVYPDIISGKEESRPQYDEMFLEAHQKKFDVVLFWSFDRFARSGTLFTLQKLKELENLGINWHSYTEPYISSVGPWKDVVISIFATVAKLEREHISERTKAGLDRIKETLKEGKGYTSKSGNKITQLGRPTIPEETIKQVLDYLKEGKLSYTQISEKVIYKIKHGAERHISPAQITQIKKKHLENGSQK